MIGMKKKRIEKIKKTTTISASSEKRTTSEEERLKRVSSGIEEYKGIVVHQKKRKARKKNIENESNGNGKSVRIQSSIF